MLEESRMDKKSLNRSTQPQSRAAAFDCKKNTELTHKPLPRNNKKREGSGSTPKNEPFRRNAPAQRGRGQVDRRSHPRGPSGHLVGGTQNTRVEDDNEPEIGSVFVPGIKKQNLNHLLNFMYPSRGTERGGPMQRRYKPMCLTYRPDKDLYLRAYCQFVVNENGDYKTNLLDPDVPVKWEQIEEIVVRSIGRSECPICLGVLVAGRVGPCGHVYCWACVLHYEAAHELQRPPCPVCTMHLNVKDMKPTRMVQWEAPAEEVTMRLVRRLRGTTTVEVAPPRGQLVDNDPIPILPLKEINDAPFCKLFAANKQQVLDIVERERKEIEAQILAEIDTSEVVFLEEALKMLKLKEEKMQLPYEKPKIVEDKPEETVPFVYEKQAVNEGHIDWFDVTDEGAACNYVENQGDSETVDSNLNPEAPEFPCDADGIQPEEFPLTECLPECEKIEVTSTFTDIDKQNQAKYFYFYQAEDGQQVFLNGLNIRMLNASFGGLAAAPPIICGRVLHRETFPLIEQSRKHMPFTAHLPLYCSFDIVELDLQPPYVTMATLQSFAEELDRRGRARARHEREERRRERAHRRALEGPPRPDFSSPDLFPPAAPPFASFSSPPAASFEPQSPSTSTTSPTPGTSFAKMASTSGTWRVRKSSASQPVAAVEGEEVEEAGAPRALCLSDAIEAALQAAPSPSSKKKNKKSKHKVLFATGMQRAA